MNIYYYNAMLHVFCEEFGFNVGKLIGNLSNVHLYDNSLKAVGEILVKSSRQITKKESSMLVHINRDALIKMVMKEDWDNCIEVIGHETKVKLFDVCLYKRIGDIKKPPVYKVEMLTYNK